MDKLKLYLETSVWNFYYADDALEKKEITRQFFAQIQQGVYEIFISDVVYQEISRATDEKNAILHELIRKVKPRILPIPMEANSLSQLYISRDVLPEKATEDATHVAIATFFEMDAIISWNLRHIANLRRMELVNAVNVKAGYLKRLELITPLEVLHG